MSGGGSAFEAAGAPANIQTALDAGLDVIDLNQTVNFTLYKRVVLPADGFVFWVKADVLSPGASLNTSLVNQVPVNQPGLLSQSAPSFQARGSLHHTTVNKQDPDESYSVHRMTFTSKDEVDKLGAIAPDEMYMALTDGQRYAFSTRSMWYRQAGLYHYSGDAVYPTMSTQVIDDPAQLDLSNQVVSNSTPIWLMLNQLFPIYPSLLVPDNIVPPYGVINITEEDTSPLQAGPWKDASGTRWQLMKDVVKIVTYGVRNDRILDWIDAVQEYTLANPSVMGVMNTPAVRDANRGQVEISAKAQKKEITFEVSYYQSRVLDMSRQLIRSAFLDHFFAEGGVSVSVN